MAGPFEGFDFTGFWDDDDYAITEYLEPPPTPEMIAKVESQLGYKLPASYVALMNVRNGGIPLKQDYPAPDDARYPYGFEGISGIKGIGFTKDWSLCGEFGSRTAIDDGFYPEIGVYFGDTHSGGHDMIALDYRDCGTSGEPRVIHVNQELDYRISFIAPDFETFIRGLREYEPDADG